MYEEKCQEVESFEVEYVTLLRTKDKGLEMLLSKVIRYRYPLGTER